VVGAFVSSLASVSVNRVIIFNLLKKCYKFCTFNEMEENQK
jgi:hypothetical protein